MELSRFALDTWDHGRLKINRIFADLLRRHHWSTFEVIWSKTAEAAIAKKLRTDRVTLRFTLNDGQADRVFYIKRHSQSALQEYIKPLLHFRWPILGARNEWNALLAFHEAGLPTMTPVALGERGANSFLITEGLEDCTKLSELPALSPGVPPNDLICSTAISTNDLRTLLVRRVARVTQQMHRAGLHHQDYYLGHLLMPNRVSCEREDRVYVIDLGRVRRQQPLSARWIVKDLAQLNYSAKDVRRTDRFRFLREYLGRKIGKTEKRLIAQITAKTASIARHTEKNHL